MEKDIKVEGELHKYMLQAMSKPDSLAYWNKSKFEKIAKADNAMKQRKRDRQ